MVKRTDEADAAIALADDYFVAMIEANETELRRVFHPKAYIIGHFGGALEFATVDEFIASTSDARTGDGPFDYAIDDAKLVGDTALVTVTGCCYGAWITDNLSMVKIDGRWQIVNKTFYAQP